MATLLLLITSSYIDSIITARDNGAILEITTSGEVRVGNRHRGTKDTGESSVQG